MTQLRKSNEQHQPGFWAAFWVSFIAFSVLLMLSQILIYGPLGIPRWVLACSAALFSVAFFVAQRSGNFQGIGYGAVLFAVSCLHPILFTLVPEAAQNRDMWHNLMMSMRTVFPYVPLLAGALALLHSACV